MSERKPLKSGGLASRRSPAQRRSATTVGKGPKGTKRGAEKGGKKGQPVAKTAARTGSRSASETAKAPVSSSFGSRDRPLFFLLIVVLMGGLGVLGYEALRPSPTRAPSSMRAPVVAERTPVKPSVGAVVPPGPSKRPPGSVDMAAVPPPPPPIPHSMFVKPAAQLPEPKPAPTEPEPKRVSNAAPPPLPRALFTSPPPIVTAMVVPPKRALPKAPLPPAKETWRRYAQKAPTDRNKPWLAIVIDDVGVARTALPELLRLKGPLTMSVMGYAERMADFEAQARREGDELLVHVPMQPIGKQDPGPNALLVGLSSKELRRRLDWQLAHHSGYIGINNHMGSRFTTDIAGMTVVADALRAKGLMFLDSRTIASSVAAQVARAKGLPTVVRDVFLDNDIDAKGIEEQLARAEKIARERGTAIAIGHPHAETLAALRAFIPLAEAQGIILAPLSAVLDRRDAGVKMTGRSAIKSVAESPPS